MMIKCIGGVIRYDNYKLHIFLVDTSITFQMIGTEKRERNWWRIGIPVQYINDSVAQLVEQ